ncbi:MAG: hypothetical protein ACREAZ_04515 [Nitrososphaera sp.]
MSRLFGVFASHSPESCPLNNAESRKKFIQMEDKIHSRISKHRISRIVGFYMSVLEHGWVIILEGDSAHEIENFCIDVGISAFNTVKIVPLDSFDHVIKKVKSKLA